MKSILIIGMGRFGQHLCRKLMELENEVMIVDQKEETLEELLPYVTNAKVGDCTKVEVLKSFGIRNFDVCIVCIGTNFQSSLEITSSLKELGAKRVISKATRDVHAKFLLRNGADEVVYPEKQLASWTAIRCTSSHILDYIELDKDCSIFELAVPEEWSGKSIVQLDIRKKYKINVLGVRENGKLNMNFSPDTVLGRDRSILVLGEQRAVQKCFRI